MRRHAASTKIVQQHRTVVGVLKWGHSMQNPHDSLRVLFRILLALSSDRPSPAVDENLAPTMAPNYSNL